MLDPLVLLVFLALAPSTVAPAARAQPADCAGPPPGSAPALPMELNLAGLPGVPLGVRGQIYVAVPLAPGGMTCTDRRPPLRDILRGKPGDVLHGAQGDPLRGPSK